MVRFFRSGSLRRPPAKPKRPEQSSPRERGYDASWDRRSASFRERNPFCARCFEKGRLRFGDVTDHKYPVQDGGEVHCDDGGLWSLCTPCHAWKGRLERYARERGLMSMIVEWCDRPDLRPTLR